MFHTLDRLPVPFLLSVLVPLLPMGGCASACPDDETQDDDDASDDDTGDDDANDDDTGDDDANDDDTGDDDTGDDDTVHMWGRAWYTEPGGYIQEQALLGSPPDNWCPFCDYSFSIVYTTTWSTGTCEYCLGTPDGYYNLAYDSDYWAGYQEIAAIVVPYGPDWIYWYKAYPGQGGHLLEFRYSIFKYGYWDLGAKPE